jgi:hypothetical protein
MNAWSCLGSRRYAGRGTLAACSTASRCRPSSLSTATRYELAGRKFGPLSLLSRAFLRYSSAFVKCCILRSRSGVRKPNT